MRKIILGLMLLSTVGCSTLGAVADAPQAKSDLIEYLADNDAALADIKGPLAQLETLYRKVSDKDQEQAFYAYALLNMNDITRASRAWASIVNVVTAHLNSGGGPVPQSLIDFRADIEADWGKLYKAYQYKDGAIKLAEFVALVAKMKARL